MGLPQHLENYVIFENVAALIDKLYLAITFYVVVNVNYPFCRVYGILFEMHDKKNCQLTISTILSRPYKTSIKTLVQYSRAHVCRLKNLTWATKPYRRETHLPFVRVRVTLNSDQSQASMGKILTNHRPP